MSGRRLTSNLTIGWAKKETPDTRKGEHENIGRGASTMWGVWGGQSERGIREKRGGGVT